MPEPHSSSDYNDAYQLTQQVSAALTSSATYEPTFNNVTTVTDPLNHTATFAYDSKGNLTSATDALKRQTTFTYNTAGQVLTSTDPLNRTMRYTDNGGDLVAAEDSLGRTVSQFVDSAGRTSRLTNPVGDGH